MFKNVASQKLAVYAHDTAADAAKTGDAANITANICLDGTVNSSNSTNDVNPTELDATDFPGVYVFDLTQAETNADMIVLAAVSSTADIALEPVVVYTLPGDNAALAADVLELGSSTQSATDLKDFADAGYDPATNKVQGVVLVDTTTTNTDMVTEPPTAAAIRTEIDANSTQLAAIVADTDELQTDDTPGALATIEGKIDTVDTNVDAVFVDTDFLVQCLLNKRYLEKASDGTWYLHVRNAGDSADIVNKALKDKDGADITDLAAGILAQELISSV